MRWRVLLIVVAALTAGCLGLGGADTETVTPVEVPETGSGTSLDPVLAPGIPADDRIDPYALAAAHRRALANQSYVWSYRRVTDVQRPDGSTTTYRYDTLRLEDGTTYRRNVTTIRVSNGQRQVYYPTFGAFANGSVSVTRDWVPRSQRYYYDRGPLTDKRAHYATLAERLVRRYLAVENATVTELPGAGGDRYRVVSNEVPPVWDPSIVAYTVRATVTADGVVTAVQANYTAVRGNTTVTSSVRFRYRDIGDVRVASPAWAATAVNRTDRTPAPDPEQKQSGRVP